MITLNQNSSSPTIGKEIDGALVTDNIQKPILAQEDSGPLYIWNFYM